MKSMGDDQPNSFSLLPVCFFMRTFDQLFIYLAMISGILLIKEKLCLASPVFLHVCVYTNVFSTGIR